MFKTPEKYRVTSGRMASTEENGCNGVFQIKPDPVTFFNIQASDGLGWEHVSVTKRQKGKLALPTWDEMCAIKDMFWDKEDCVVQYHPPKSEYVNVHPGCLHLWREVGKEYNRPPKELIG